MKKINKKEAERILAHIKKAKEIFQKAEEESDDGSIGMLDELFVNIAEAAGDLEYYINNTHWL